MNSDMVEKRWHAYQAIMGPFHMIPTQHISVRINGWLPNLARRYHVVHTSSTASAVVTAEDSQSGNHLSLWGNPDNFRFPPGAVIHICVPASRSSKSPDKVHVNRMAATWGIGGDLVNRNQGRNTKRGSLTGFLGVLSFRWLFLGKPTYGHSRVCTSEDACFTHTSILHGTAYMACYGANWSTVCSL
jgi:hypothetical protein